MHSVAPGHRVRFGMQTSFVSVAAGTVAVFVIVTMEEAVMVIVFETVLVVYRVGEGSVIVLGRMDRQEHAELYSAGLYPQARPA